jgi:sigma-B regulation protein RsbU (phosphoserine phosphatase)
MEASSLKFIGEMLLKLINSMAVMVVVAYLLTRIVSYSDLRTRELSRGHRLLLILVFGLFTIYATHSGITVRGAYAHVRSLGPVIAGLAGGPLVGLATGVIGGAHRYLLGGFTAVPCSLATVLAGLAGGIMYRIFKGRPLAIWQAVLLIVGVEALHMGLVLLIARPFAQAVQVVREIALPIVVANSQPDRRAGDPSSPRTHRERAQHCHGDPSQRAAADLPALPESPGVRDLCLHASRPGSRGRFL